MELYLEILKGFGGLIIAIIISNIFAYKQLKNQTFFNRVVFSLVNVKNKKLHIIPLLEKNFQDIWPNNHLLFQAIQQQASSNESFIHLNPEFQNIINSGIKNQIHQHFNTNLPKLEKGDYQILTLKAFLTTSKNNKNISQIKAFLYSDHTALAIQSEFALLVAVNPSKNDVIEKILHAHLNPNNKFSFSVQIYE